MTGVTPAWMLSPHHGVSTNVEIPQRLKLGIDMDGVLANFGGAYAGIAKTLFGLELDLTQQTGWDFHCLGISKEQDEIIWSHINSTVNFWCDCIEPLPYAGELRWAQYRHDLFFITSRTQTKGGSPAQQTAEWLTNYHDIEYPTVLVVEQPGQKIPIALALELNAFIDDKPSTVQKMREAGILTYVFDQPYNRNLESPRVTCVNDFIRAVEAPTETRWTV